MDVRDDRRQSPIRLFRKRVLQIAATQPGLDVGDRDPGVKGRQRSGEGRCRVALHDDQVRPICGEATGHLLEHAAGQLGKRLIGAHQIQIDVGRDLEQGQHLVEHLPVLRGRDHGRLEELGLSSQGENEWHELEGFRPRAQHDRDPPAPGCGVASVHGLSLDPGL